MEISQLKIDLKVGDTLVLDGGKVTLTLEQKSGQVARLSVQADRSVQIKKQPKQ
jgi:pyruvate kinase